MHLFRSPNRPASSRRALLRDLTDGLMQQMVFWGYDVRHRDGNLLLESGMTRVARTEETAEGSSRYRMDWREGMVELHSFCAGWYPRVGEGVVFIRHRERLYSVFGHKPLTPGGCGEDLQSSAADTMLHACRPLVEWVDAYESWVEAHTTGDYRYKCWKKLLSRTGGKPWLPPGKARQWRERFLVDPESTPRARELLRTKPKRPPGGYRADPRPNRPSHGSRKIMS